MSQPQAAPDRILVGGSVWTGDARHPRAEAIAIEGSRITAAGGADEIRRLAGPDTEIVELDGRFVMPGFIDTHTHFLEGGLRLASVDLRDAATPEEFTRRLSEYAGTVPPGTWILGGDWDHELWGGAARPAMDRRGHAGPSGIRHRLDWHMALANSGHGDGRVRPGWPDPPAAKSSGTGPAGRRECSRMRR